MGYECCTNGQPKVVGWVIVARGSANSHLKAPFHPRVITQTQTSRLSPLIRQSFTTRNHGFFIAACCRASLRPPHWYSRVGSCTEGPSFPSFACIELWISQEQQRLTQWDRVV